MTNNTLDPASASVTINTTIWVLTTVAASFVVARLAARQHTHTLGADDLAILVSLITVIVYSALISVDVHYGLGQHLKDVPLKNLTKALIFNLAASSAGSLAFTVPKLAVALLLVRIFSVNRWVVWFLPLLALSALALGIVNAILLWVRCSPLQGAWEPQNYPNAVCWRPDIEVNYSYFFGCWNAFLDLFLAVFPVYFLWNLEMDVRRKFAIGIMMGLGVVASAVGFYKIFFIKGLADPSDITFSSAPLLLWTSIESNLIIMMACVPTLGKIFRSVQEHTSIFSSRRSWRSSRKTGYKQSLKLTSSGAQGKGVGDATDLDYLVAQIERSNRTREEINGGQTTGKAADASSADVELERPEACRTKSANDEDWYPSVRAKDGADEGDLNRPRFL